MAFGLQTIKRIGRTCEPRPLPADLFDETSMETPIVNDRSMEWWDPREACSSGL
jgi:hypothetical protein